MPSSRRIVSRDATRPASDCCVSDPVALTHYERWTPDDGFPG